MRKICRNKCLNLSLRAENVKAQKLKEQERQNSEYFWNIFVNTYRNSQAKKKIRELQADIDAHSEEKNKIEKLLSKSIEALKEMKLEVDNLDSGKIFDS